MEAPSRLSRYQAGDFHISSEVCVRWYVAFKISTELSGGSRLYCSAFHFRERALPPSIKMDHSWMTSRADPERSHEIEVLQ